MRSLAYVTAVLLASTPALAQNSVAAETLVVDPPTIHAAGVAWFVTGDANWNATATLEFRELGTTAWLPAQPLLRVENNAIGSVHPGNLLAGSVFGLRAGHSYELRVTLADPDGGAAQATVMVTTRAQPPATDIATVRHVTPGTGGGSGTIADPFRGLAAADAAAQPGDVFVLAPGSYERGRLTRDGSEGAPITYRGSDSTMVIVDGAGGTSAVIDARDRSHIVIENMTVTDAQVGVAADNSRGIVLRQLLVHDIRRISGDPVAIRVGGAARDGYVCDNVLLGPEQWAQRIDDSFGIKVSGAGHVICHNRIEQFWDNIGMANASGTDAAISVDIHGNILLGATDDGIETDYAQRNVRVYENQIAGSLKGVTAQPVYGGPVYFIRNEIFDTESSPYKFHATTQGRPSGLLVYHNTTAVNGRAFSGGEWFNGHFRNNLFYGSSGYVMETLGSAATFDYNGWAPKQTPVLKLNDIRYDTINVACGNPNVDDFCGSTGNEVHAIAISRADWTAVGEPVGWSGSGPVMAGSWDFMLAPSSPAIDSASLLANINDGFTGNGPDRGALERGGPPRQYGPRGDVPIDPVSGDAGVDGDGGMNGADDAGAPGAGCGCQSSGAGAGLLVALVACGVYRRRRRAVISLVIVTGCRFGFDDLVPSGAGDDEPPQLGTGPDAYRDVSAGRQHSCAVDFAGAVWCWGNNTDGQVAPDQSVVTVTTPVRVLLDEPVVQVHAGRDASCARTESGHIWCWGVLANDVMPPSRGPYEIDLGGARAADLGVGARAACIVRAGDRAVLCWGQNDHGQLGAPGPSTGTLQPVTGSAGTLQLSVGHHHACRIDSTSIAICWGRNHSCQLGHCDDTDHAPVALLSLGPVARVTAAGRVTCATSPAGEVRCWGQNEAGTVGLSDLADHALPGPVVLSGAVDAQPASESACALRADGRVACWGAGGHGDGDHALRTTPGLAAVDSVIQLSKRYHHACVNRGTEIACWGGNEEGELGRRTRAIEARPDAVELGLGGVTSLAIANTHACAIANQQVWCWGRNLQSQLGDGTRTGSVTPVPAATGLPTVEGVATGMWHSCAWGAGTARCWGQSWFGQAGAPNGSLIPSPQVIPLAGVTQVVTGTAHSCAIAGGDVYCWGGNSNGQLGPAASGATSTPTQIPGLSAVTQLSAGSAFTCALHGASRRVTCWGANDKGQLGGGTTSGNAPTLLSLTGVSELSAGAEHVCAVLESGELWCWGSNGDGELGLGDFVARSSPVPLALGAFAAVSAGGHGTCARTVTQELYCWGEGRHGELGTGTLARIPTPTLVGGGTTEIERGPGTTCARQNGVLHCWGRTRLFGDGRTAELDLPAPVASAEIGH